MEFLTSNLGLLIGGGSSAVALWVLKAIPNEDIYSWVETGAYCLGTTMTLGLGKWKFTKRDLCMGRGYLLYSRKIYDIRISTMEVY